MSQDGRSQYKSDPYRATRKTPSPEGYYNSPSVHSEQTYSRSPSESSTSRLANRNEPIAPLEESYYQQDPYAPKTRTKKKKRAHAPKPQQYTEDEKRANSYLPYSNHNRNPYDPVEPIYLEDDDYLPSFNSPNQHQHNQRGPIGSILQDNIVMDAIHDRPPPHDDSFEYTKNPTHSVLIPPAKKKRWWTRCGLSGRKLVFIVFIFILVVVIIWYFVWPRSPTLQFQAAALANDEQPFYNDTMMVANWNVNFTVLNEDNWVPTHIKKFAVNVVENSSGEVFGKGNSKSLVLKARSSDQVITIPISIYLQRDQTNPTLKTLLSACRVKDMDLTTSPKQSLDISFQFVYYISGIVWQTHTEVSPQSYFDCPS